MILKQNEYTVEEFAALAIVFRFSAYCENLMLTGIIDLKKTEKIGLPTFFLGEL